MDRNIPALMITSAIALGGCASLPSGPNVMVLPGSSKSFEQFRADDYRCREYAYGQIGGKTPAQAQVRSGLGSAAAGAALGAATGAALGGGEGAAIGAGTGLAAGGVVGTGMAQESGRSTQDRYDIHYIQCMYAEGHRVPVYGNFTADIPRDRGPAVPPPPPPPGAPPSPPPR